MRILIITICILVSIIRCKEKNIPPVIVDRAIEIRYIDTNNRDLLDQSKSYAYEFTAMQHYFVNKNGNKMIVNVGNLTYPKEMFIYKDVDSIPATLRFFPHIETFENGLRDFTDYIQLDNFDEDTIQTQIEITNNSSILKTVKYNGRSVGRNIVISK